MKTFASLFSGFGGADCGAKSAGLDLAWGLEYDPAIAEVGNFNLGNHIRVADILDCNPRDFERVDVLHASPVCTEFSAAKTNGKESALDIACARKVAEFVTVLHPEIFTLENVMAYRKSKSWHIINEALNDAGYWLNIEICNAANYSVPQTRKRMIVRAIRGGFVPYLPQPEPWLGWYQAIEDLIPSLPETQFADWQQDFIPRDRTRPFMVSGQNARNAVGYRSGDDPIFTITASQKAPMRFQAKDNRIYAMTPRCFARFQSFSDDYAFPNNNKLACRGIGNAVCPLMMEKIYRGLIPCHDSER